MFYRVMQVVDGKEINVLNGTLDECNDYVAEVDEHLIGEELVFKIESSQESAEYYQEY